MDIDTPPHLDNLLPAETESLDKETGVTGAGTEVPTEGDMTTADDVDMDAQDPNQPSLGTKQLGTSTLGAGVASGKAGGDAGTEGRTTSAGETGEAFPTRVADFFKPRPKGTINGTANAKGKGKQTTSEEYLSGREGLPWYVRYSLCLMRDAHRLLHCVGLRSIDQIRWMMLSRTRILLEQVSYFIGYGCSWPAECSLAVENFIKKGRLPHLLFYGPPGTPTYRPSPRKTQSTNGMPKQQVPEKHRLSSPLHA